MIDRFLKKKQQEEKEEKENENQEQLQEEKENEDKEKEKKKKLIGLILAGLIGGGYFAYKFILSSPNQPPEPVINTTPSPIEGGGDMVNIPPPPQPNQNQTSPTPPNQANQDQKPPTPIPPSQSQPKNQQPPNQNQSTPTAVETKQPPVVQQETKPVVVAKQEDKRQVPQVSPLPSSDVRKDVFTGKDLNLSELEKQREILELQAKIKQLELEIAEKESKVKEIKGQPIKPKETEILKQEIDILKMQLSKKQEESRQFAGSGNPQELAYSVKAVICDTTCRAVVSTQVGEFTVIKGSKLLDGTTVVDVKNDGVVFNRFGQQFYKPVELFIPPQEKQDTQVKTQPTQRQQQFQTTQPQQIQPFMPYQRPLQEGE